MDSMATAVNLYYQKYEMFYIQTIWLNGLACCYAACQHQTKLFSTFYLGRSRNIEIDLIGKSHHMDEVELLQ